MLRHLTFSDTRRQQLSELSSASDEVESSDAKKKHDRAFAISLASLLLATGGLLYSPLSLLSIPGVIYLTRELYEGAYNSLVKEHKANADVLDAIITAILLTCYPTAIK